jgi:hypothetical protein
VDRTKRPEQIYMALKRGRRLGHHYERHLRTMEARCSRDVRGMELVQGGSGMVWGLVHTYLRSTSKTENRQAKESGLVC